LTAPGREKLRRASLGMQALGLKFDAVLSSPYLRATQTAEIVMQVYKLKTKNIYFTDNLLPPASIGKLLQTVHEHFPKSKNVLLVGHEPHLTAMISGLLKSSKPLDINFKKGGLCNVSIDQPSGSTMLNWLLTSTQLALMTKEKE
jgi:phosphohistidine phosphatase